MQGFCFISMRERIFQEKNGFSSVCFPRKFNLFSRDSSKNIGFFGMLPQMGVWKLMCCFVSNWTSALAMRRLHCRKKNIVFHCMLICNWALLGWDMVFYKLGLSMEVWILMKFVDYFRVCAMLRIVMFFFVQVFRLMKLCFGCGVL